MSIRKTPGPQAFTFGAESTDAVVSVFAAAGATFTVMETADNPEPDRD